MIAIRKDLAVFFGVLLMLLLLWTYLPKRHWEVTFREEGPDRSLLALRVLTVQRLTNQEPPVLLAERTEGTNLVRLLAVPTVVADAYVCGTAEGTNRVPLFRVLQVLGASTNLVTVREIRGPKGEIRNEIRAQGERGRMAETDQPAVK
jgi:hypothetical protein